MMNQLGLFGMVIRIQALLILGYALFRHFTLGQMHSHPYASKHAPLQKQLLFLFFTFLFDFTARVLAPTRMTPLIPWAQIASDIMLILFSFSLYATTSHRGTIIHAAELRSRLNASNRVIAASAVLGALLLIASGASLLAPAASGSATTGMAVRNSVKGIAMTPGIFFFALGCTTLLMIAFFRRELIH